MNNNSVNKPLIVFSVFISALLLALAEAGSQVKLTSFSDYLGTGIVYIAIYPFIAIWFRAIWNEIMHKIFNLPLLNTWQAAGMLILLFLFFGMG